jgi:hypothetical protein
MNPVVASGEHCFSRLGRLKQLLVLHRSAPDAEQDRRLAPCRLRLRGRGREIGQLDAALAYAPSEGRASFCCRAIELSRSRFMWHNPLCPPRVGVRCQANIDRLALW